MPAYLQWLHDIGATSCQHLPLQEGGFGVMHQQQDTTVVVVIKIQADLNPEKFK